MSNKRVYEVGEEFFDTDLGFKVRCVEASTVPICLVCIYDSIPDACYTAVCFSSARRRHPECKTPVDVHFEKVEEDAGNNQ